LVQFSPRDEDSIRESLKHSDIVINLIGKHYETKHAVPTRRADGSLSRVNFSFEEVHVDIARRIARISKEAGVKSLIHVSALSADLESESKWSLTKAMGEEFPDAVSEVKHNSSFKIFYLLSPTLYIITISILAI
jgi:NADH dehydrogenase (ubiquinone) 1 alpha subcomplex subunit 9